MTENMRNRLFRPKYGKVESFSESFTPEPRTVLLPAVKMHAPRLPMKKTVHVRPGESTLTPTQKKLKKVTRKMAKKGTAEPFRERISLTQKKDDDSTMMDDDEPLLNWSKLNSAKKKHGLQLIRY